MSTIIEQQFSNKATVSSILETDWGRIAVILLPRRHSALYVDSTLVATIDEGLAFAQSLGARMVSLTGILPSATDYGRALLTSCGQQPNLPQVTTGHAMTAASVVLNVEHILEEAGRTLSYERVACLGLGSIGLSSLRLLLQVAPHPQQILLCDLASKQQQLHALRAELRQQYAFRGEIQIVSVRNEVPSDIYTATLVLGATNVPDVLDVARLSPGTLLVDDSGPHCFDPQLAITRFEQQQDLLFTEGGAIQLPTPMRQTIYRPPQLEMLFAEGALTEPRTIMGCAFSSLLSAKWPTLVPTIGEIDPATALTYYRTIKAMGICAAPLHCADYLLPSAPIALFRERHRLF